MTLRVLNDLDQGTPEWHAQRRGMVTASVVGRLISVGYLGADGYDCPECGALAGYACVSRARKVAEPIKTHHRARAELAASNRSESAQVITPSTGDEARGLTLLLAAERITGHTDPTYMSDDMWMGIENEPIARDVYAQHFAPVETVGFMVRDFGGFSLGFSPDGLVGDEGLIEIKSRRDKSQLGTIIDGRVPIANFAQLQAGLLVSGRLWIDYVSYAGGMKLWVRRVYPDQRWFDAITAAVYQFEQTASWMVSTYREATQGMPDTQRLDLEMVI